MGILRLYLAVCVIAQHTEAVLPWTMHSGRVAVQIFFVISGFYMQFILHGNKYAGVGEFYRSRALRIFVPYFVILGLVLLLSAASGWFLNDWLTLSATVDSRGAGLLGGTLAGLTNFTLFFQDWIQYFEHDQGDSFRFTTAYLESRDPLYRFVWIPQAWTVGLELTFYLIVPFLALRLSTVKLIGILLLSIVARAVCYQNLGLSNDPWTYRFFPFELAYFVTGMIGCRWLLRKPELFRALAGRLRSLAPSGGKIGFAFVVVGVIGGLALHAWLLDAMVNWANGRHPLGGEMIYLAALVGWLPGVPLLFQLTREFPVDRTVGELSYPVYLLHLTIAMFLFGRLSPEHQPLIGELTTVITIAAAVLLQSRLLQPFEDWRQRSIRGLDKALHR